MSGPFEWRIQDIERTANRAESRLYEIDSLRSDVGSLEHTVLELRAEIDGLRAELQASQIQHTQDIAELREVIDALGELRLWTARIGVAGKQQPSLTSNSMRRVSMLKI